MNTIKTLNTKKKIGIIITIKQKNYSLRQENITT